MGKGQKGGFMTPKAIGNRQKAAGLQKLRWYCQMCNKQCRDENGFKCHKTSEGHNRQMKVYSENAESIVKGYSVEFEQDFFKLFRLQGGRRVKANVVYRQYIKDREHFHMNSTWWSTLSEFVQYMGKKGKAEVEKAEKGDWWITYIDRDPAVLARQAKVQEVLRAEQKDRIRSDRRAEEQRKRAMAAAKPTKERELKEFERKDGETIQLSVKLSTLQKARKTRTEFSAFEEPEAIENSTRKSKKRKASQLSTLQSLKKELEESKFKKRKFEMEREQQKKKQEEDADPKKVITKTKWLRKGIIVKIMNKKLGKYHKKKGVVKDILGYGCRLQMLKSNAKIEIDQVFVETVIPANERMVMILCGPHAGRKGKLKALNTENFTGKIKLKEGPDKGIKTDVPFEWFTKLHIE